MIALVGALAPAAANADTVSFSGGAGAEFDKFADVFPNETDTQKVGVVLNWNGAEHLVPGSQVQLSPGPLDPGFAAGPVTITVPSTWGLNQTARVDATATYTAGPNLQITQQHFLTWNPTTYSCTLGGTSCLTVSGNWRVDTRIHPHNVSNLVADAGVNDANITWDHSPEHLQLTEYILFRDRVNSSGVPVERTPFVLSPTDTTSFHDTGLLPSTRYCWWVRSQKVVTIPPAGSQVIPGPTPEPQVCRTMGTNPPAPASGVDGPALSGDGEVDLTWGASSEAGVLYDVDHKNQAGDWTRLATGVSGTSYTAHEPEGTWAYRVRSTNSQRGVSGFVDSPARVKVDLTAPSAPEATTDPAAPAFGDWFKDEVTVSFGGSTDPALDDGSAGSGVASYTDPQTFDTDGSHTASGTATDGEGHESAATEKTVKVDRSLPTVAITCPTDIVQQGSDASATWTAQDGESGLAGESEGTVALDTSTGGHHTSPAAPAPVDNVGHTGADDVTCTYEVNPPPDAPGAPAGPALTRDGTFDVNWDGATDPEGDTVAYEIQERDEDDADWSAAAAADLAEYGAHVPNDGTWSFRVRALDGRGGESGWVASTSPTKFDDSAPSAPSAVTDPADPASANGWFKDHVSVGWGGSSDPQLEDGSAGSGVASYSDARSFDTDGEHGHSGTATDAAGNESDSADATVKVDASKPRVAITCPADRIPSGADAQATWTAVDDESGLATPAEGSVDLETDTPGTKTATAPAASDAVGHDSDPASCEYEVLPPNSPPGAPGSPNGPAFDGDGDLTVSWTKADDPDEGDAAAYVLEGRDDDDADWSQLADGLSDPRSDVTLADGTWTFRVKAVDTHGAETEWVESSSPTVVDGGKPTAPTATTNPADPASANGWFKDSVKVTFGGSSDPGLADGSDGSGVDSYTGAATFDTEGTHTATGTAVDRAGNESDATSKTVKVDATAPSTSISCPSEPLIVGQPGATATWTASDAGSGLATPASGSVALNTATAGVRTASAPAAKDSVGHTGDTATCQYEVRYRFTGGVAPVEGSHVLNVGRRGHTYPVRWRLTRWNGSLISDAEGTALARQMSATDTKVACSSFLSQDEDALEEETGLPSPSLRYDTRKNWFVYSYRAPGIGCYTLDVHRADGLNTKRWRFLFL